MSTMTIQQAPSLRFDGSTVEIGDESFDLGEIATLRSKTKGGLIGGFRVVYTVTMTDGRQHVITVPPLTGDSGAYVAIQDALRKRQEAQDEAESVMGTVSFAGHVSPAQLRGGHVYLRKGTDGPFVRRVNAGHFIPNDAPNARHLA